MTPLNHITKIKLNRANKLTLFGHARMALEHAGMAFEHDGKTFQHAGTTLKSDGSTLRYYGVTFDLALKCQDKSWAIIAKIVPLC